MFTVFEKMDVLTLPPGVNEHKNVISSDSEHDEHGETVQITKECNLQYTLSDEHSEREAEKDHHDSSESQKERLQVVDEVEEDESD